MIVLKYCPSCGVELGDKEQNFCEKCGANLDDYTKEGKIESQGDSKSPNIIQAPSKLFDLNRNYYILKEKYWDWGSGDILDNQGQIIGKMHRKILSIRKKVELMELDGTVSATINAKLISARAAQDIKDGEGNLIARIKKKIMTLLKPKFFLESPEGERLYEAQGNFMGFSFKVKDLTSNQIVAEIEKAKKWRDVFLSGVFDFKDTYALKILDNKTDRRILVGFVLSIDNVLHDA